MTAKTKTILKKNKEDKNTLVVAAECEDMQTAEGILRNQKK